MAKNNETVNETVIVDNNVKAPATPTVNSVEAKAARAYNALEAKRKALVNT